MLEKYDKLSKVKSTPPPKQTENNMKSKEVPTKNEKPLTSESKE